jgi:hypothetical protein
VDLPESNRLEALGLGSTQVWLETEDGRVASNKVECEVVPATDVDVSVPAEILLQGQRLMLSVTFHTAKGPRAMGGSW